MHSHDQDDVAVTATRPGDAAPVAPGLSTGDAGVDEALGRLTELDGLPVGEHVRVFEAVHAALQDRLADGEV